jgi:uncharacterized protein YegJ (DUF2314 family)
MAYEKRAESGNVFNAESADAQMNWAMEKARLTIGYFKESIQQPQENQYGHSLKVRIQDANGTEHMWLGDLSLDDDGLYYGMIDSDPVTVTSVQVGTRIGIPHDAISDWLLVEDGRLIGGYTIRVYRESLSDSERIEFDRGFGIGIDYGYDFFPHDMKTPEGAILCLEDAYTANDVAAALACKDFETEARMLLEQIPSMAGYAEELVTQTAETLRLSFEAHMRSGGVPSFAGFHHAFPEREFLNPDTVIVSEICYHPDGRMTLDRLIVTRHGDEWRVGPPVNTEEGEEEG